MLLNSVIKWKLHITYLLWWGVQDELWWDMVSDENCPGNKLLLLKMINWFIYNLSIST